MSELTITEFLLARVAEREALARAALEKSESTGDPHWYVDGPAAVSGKHWIYASGEKFTHREIADFIAANDPRFVLAECEAVRRIIEWHQNWPVLAETEPVFEQAYATDVNSMTMRMTKQIAWTTEQKYRDHFGTEPPTGPILRFMVQPYADHADFDPDWIS